MLYAWYKDHVFNFIRPRLKPYAFVSHSGKLFFSSVTVDDQGEYFCVVSSPKKNQWSTEGKVSTAISLVVEEAGEWDAISRGI